MDKISNGNQWEVIGHCARILQAMEFKNVPNRSQ